jgi:hypothetical protein
LDRIELSSALGDRHARFQPADGGEVEVALSLSLLVGDCQRHPHIVLQRELKTGNQVRATGKLKSFRHYADDLRVLTGERKRLAEHIWVAAEMSLPESVADDRDRRAIRHVFFRRERAAQYWTSTNRFKEIRGYSCATQQLRISASGQLPRPGTKRRHAFERLRSGFESFEVGSGIRQCVCLKLRQDAPDHYDAFRIFERQRPQQRRVHNAEDRRVRADSERQRQHCDQ